MQAQIQVLLIATAGKERVIAERSNMGPNTKLPVFDGEVEQIRRFIIVCKSYLRMKIREILVEKQIQWILLYVQKELADICK